MITLAAHASERRYKQGCRCRPCKGAHAQHGKVYRAANLAKLRDYGKDYERERRKREPLTPAQQAQRSDRAFRRKYGITAAERDAILNTQGGTCGACSSADPGHRFGWQIEHDHATGEIRGVVCNKCNTLIAALGDNLAEACQRFARVCAYLDRGPMLVRAVLQALKYR